MPFSLSSSLTMQIVTSSSTQAPILKLGDSNLQVQRLQALLNQRLADAQTLVPLVEDGQFGPRTKRRLKVAQFRYLLFQDGIATEETWRSLEGDRALIEEFPILHRNTLGKSVAVVQHLLKHAGFYEGAIDYRFGPLTEASIRDFQARQTPPTSSAITVKGVVDQATWQALEKLALLQVFQP